MYGNLNQSARGKREGRLSGDNIQYGENANFDRGLMSLDGRWAEIAI